MVTELDMLLSLTHKFFPMKSALGDSAKCFVSFTFIPFWVLFFPFNGSLNQFYVFHGKFGDCTSESFR